MDFHSCILVKTITNQSLLFSIPSLSTALSIFVPLVSAFKLAGSPNCVLFTCFPSVFASVPLTVFECGRSSLLSSRPLPLARLSPPPALGFLRYGSETVGAESEAVSLPCPAGGAESFEGRDLLSSFSGLSDVGSPSCGGGLEEFIASLVLGLSRVPRTVLECGFEDILLELTHRLLGILVVFQKCVIW